MAAPQPLRALKPGMYAPIPSFFLPGSEDLDIPSFQQHVVRLAKAGIWPVLSGSMGEAPHLIPEERVAIITAARAALQAASLDHVPIIAGCNGMSTRHSITLCREAAQAGADVAIIIPNAYYGAAMSTPDGKKHLRDFYIDISNNSPIPVMLYNYPSAAGGIDMDSELLIDVARSAANTCGVKLTCNNIGKLVRVASITAAPSFASSHPRQNPNAPWLIFGGFVDTLFPALLGRGAGAITGLANVVPRTIAYLFQLSVDSINSGDTTKMAAAQELQAVVSRADFYLAQHGIGGAKWAISRYAAELGYGYSAGIPRRPLPETNQAAGPVIEKELEEVMQWERKLTQQQV